MFKFNFKIDQTGNQENDNEKQNAPTEENISNKNEANIAIVNYEAVGREVYISKQHQQRAEKYRGDCVTIQNFSLVDLKHIQELIVENTEEYKNLNSAVELESDVIKGVYEGGLKLWECTMDLLDYLEAESFTFKGLSVLDLGCGAGLLGMYALSHGAASVHFQDYNFEVIELLTIPNVLLNLSESTKCTTRFFAGDWGSLVDQMDTYDVILTSETIYNPENYCKIIKIFQKSLKKSGSVYMAAKQHYFGVGGNLRQFEKLLHQDQKWQTSICFCSNEGVKREIMKITPRS